MKKNLGVLLSKHSQPAPRAPLPRVGLAALLGRGSSEVFKSGEIKPTCRCNLAVLKAAPLPPTKRYVLAQEKPVAARLHKLFRAWAPKLAAQLIKLSKVSGTLRLLKAKRTPEQIARQAIKDLNLKGFTIEFVEIVREDLEKAARKGGLNGIELIGMENDEAMVNLVNENAVEYAKERAAELVTQINETTRELLQADVETAITDGLSAADLAELIENKGFSQARAETIARTELASAHVNGNLDAWNASGQVSGKRWILADTHPEEDICDECEEVGVIDLDANFPCGTQGPPAHPNCLCDVVPILAGEEDE